MDEKKILAAVRALIDAPSCCAEARTAAQRWLDTRDSAEGADNFEKLVEELRADILPIDALVGFAGSEAGERLFGAEGAQKLLAHARELKAEGKSYCDCPACAACADILTEAGAM